METVSEALADPRFHATVYENNVRDLPKAV